MAGMPALFEPLRLGGIALANRNAVSSMCQHSAGNGAANDWHLQHLGSLSLSGAGLVIVAHTAVEAAGRISHGCLGLYSDATEAALARVVGFCRRAGSAAGIKSTKRSKAEGRCHAYARSTNQAATRF
jgi:2,4-dienoyl-CoA reductase-like NADH-dependent reductase (Old Yellow Enzyme family)